MSFRISLSPSIFSQAFEHTDRFDNTFFPKFCYFCPMGFILILWGSYIFPLTIEQFGMLIINGNIDDINA